MNSPTLSDSERELLKQLYRQILLTTNATEKGDSFEDIVKVISPYFFYQTGEGNHDRLERLWQDLQKWKSSDLSDLDNLLEVLWKVGYLGYR